MNQKKIQGYDISNRRFDLQWNIDTEGKLRVNVEIPEFHIYEPTRVEDFLEAISKLRISDYSKFNFVDVGSGKGRCILLAAMFGFNRVIGVEVSTQLHRIAVKNVESFRSKSHINCCNIQLINIDFRQYVLPNFPTVLFLFNPFNEKVLQEVVSSLNIWTRPCIRKVFIIYMNAKNRIILDKANKFRLFLERPKYLIYTSV